MIRRDGDVLSRDVLIVTTGVEGVEIYAQLKWYLKYI